LKNTSNGKSWANYSCYIISNDKLLNWFSIFGEWSENH